LIVISLSIAAFLNLIVSDLFLFSRLTLLFNGI